MVDYTITVLFRANLGKLVAECQATVDFNASIMMEMVLVPQTVTLMWAVGPPSEYQHRDFHRADAIPSAQPTVSQHRSQTVQYQMW